MANYEAEWEAAEWEAAGWEAEFEAECGAEWVTEWEVRLLNVMLLNGRLKCQAECGAELKNMMLNVRVKCEVEYSMKLKM